MLVMIKSGPDTAEGAIALALARESGADLALLQDGVHFARSGAVGELAGRVYVLEEDQRLRGLKAAQLDARARAIGYDALTDLVAEAALALEMGAYLEDVALTIHAHPTLAEAVQGACKAALGEAIHALNRPERPARAQAGAPARA